MPSLALCFQVHQPYRLRPFSYFESKTSSDFFNAQVNEEVMLRVSGRCYVPANTVLCRAIDIFGDDFACAFSITGTALEQMRQYAPQGLASFKRLLEKPSVEVLAETYYHSLASVHGDDIEFCEQVKMHRDVMREEFGKRPTVFRNTELIYSDRIGRLVDSMGFEGVLIEGADQYFTERSRHCVYRAPGIGLRLLPRDYAISDDVAFRFHAGSPDSGALTAADMMRKLQGIAREDEVVIFYVDYETFGEHHHEDGGILSFLRDLPGVLLSTPGWRFVTPSELCRAPCIGEELSIPTEISWADTTRDVSSWLGNKMQQRAFEALYSAPIRENADPQTWRRLQTSDHFYYMSTKGAADGEVHRYFSPFEGPYDAFITYMNVLRAIEG